MLKTIIKYILILLFCGSAMSCASYVRYSSGSSGSGGYSGSGSGFPETPLEVIKGRASFYADKFNGKRTASGEIFRQSELTAAHRTLPFGTIVKVINLWNNKSVIVRINDRGPFRSGRVIDLSHSAAEEIDMIHSGVVDVEIHVLKYGEGS